MPKTRYPIRRRKRYCFFCKNKINYIDYKEIDLLKRFISDRGKIRPRRITGLCVQHQSDLAKAIKRAREVALISYTSR
ncbi:MAG: 30S ribosomal protein S18 [Actinomycetia bacterium]|nr:30S ribosomal protein S18 [Actinomycetes bacterium]